MNIENNMAIYFTIILDFTASIKFNYQNIKTTDCYQTIGDSLTIIYLDAKTTSNEHIEKSERYKTIGDSASISYLDATKVSKQHIKTSELYITKCDANIVAYHERHEE